jgi:aspartyl-tRNA(Asn)/glutamyl-tRNA(Gln) amidotransferase subunit A
MNQVPEPMIQPWMRGPLELIRHAHGHFEKDGDTDRRIALIGFDNAIEVCIDVYIRLHPKLRKGIELKREEVDAASKNYHAKLEFLDKHLDALDPVIGPRMLTGRTLSAPDYFALLRRYAELQQQVLWTLRDIDALIVPTTMAPAQPLAAIDASLHAYLDYNSKVHRNAGIGNILNLSAVSVPCGFTSEGLPIGLMIYAKPFAEDMALRVAYAYEQVTPWHARHPDLTWTGVAAGTGGA